MASLPSTTKPPSNKISVPWTTRFGDEAMYFHPGSTSWILKGKDIVDDLPAEISSEYFHMPSGLLIPTFLAQHSLPPPLPATISSSRFCTKTTHRASDGAKLHSMMMGNAGNLEGGSVGCGVHEARVCPLSLALSRCTHASPDLFPINATC